MGGDIGEIKLGSERELYKYINHYVVVKRGGGEKNNKIILVQVNIIFALPDYSSGVIERHQNLFYGRLINLALEFDIHLTTGENRSKGKIGRNLTLYILNHNNHYAGLQKIKEGVLLV